jgi:ribokinase
VETLKITVNGMAKITVVGSLNMDVVVRTAHHPSLGQTVLGSAVDYIPGGKGLNQAVASLRAGGNVRMIGKLGRDAFGVALSHFLQTEQMNTQHIQYLDNTPSGVALITVSDEGENTIVVVAGSNGKVMESDLPSHFDADEIVVAQLEIPVSTVHHLFQRAKHHHATTILNPAPSLPLLDETLQAVDYLILNETELAFYAKSSVPETTDEHLTIMKQLRASDTQTLILTLGAKGLLCLLPNDETIRVSGRTVKAVDTTGAGDCFVGAFATALSEQQPLEDALKFANTAAALSVQKHGATASMPTRDAIDSALIG